MGKKPISPEVELELKKSRETIDTIDHQILELLNQRARVVENVGNIKKQFDAEVYSPSREKAVLKQLCEHNPGPMPTESVAAVFREVISACRAFQATISVVYLGPEGSYHHSAAQANFGRSAQFVPASTVNALFDEVEHHRVDYGIVAIENSIEGSVAAHLDRLVHSQTRIVGEIFIPISHNLISFSELHEIKRVYSHPQGLAQCRQWLESNLPNAQLLEAPSTTKGVQMCQTEKNAAAVASTLAAEIYDVPIQVRGIEDFAGNTTRFFVVGRTAVPSSGDDKSSIVVFIRDQVGALYDMIEPFKRNKVNLTNIVSRPTKQEAWQYMFFLECQGHSSEERVQQAIREIEQISLYVRILGSYPSARGNENEMRRKV
ncbi:MAG: prephenate dehydratase [bacterium]|jgi:chorismate mutase/prephenate dehydratase|nr:prephenate dehydratase [bacterium]